MQSHRNQRICCRHCGRFFVDKASLHRHFQQAHSSQQYHVEEGQVHYLHGADITENGVWKPRKKSKVGAAYNTLPRNLTGGKFDKFKPSQSVPGGGLRGGADGGSNRNTPSTGAASESQVPRFMDELRKCPLTDREEMWEKVDLYTQLQDPLGENLETRCSTPIIHREDDHELDEDMDGHPDLPFVMRYTKELKARAHRNPSLVAELRPMGEGEFIQEAEEEEDTDFIEDPVDSDGEFHWEFNVDLAVSMLSKYTHIQVAPASRTEFLRWYYTPNPQPGYRARIIKILMDYIPAYASRKVRVLNPDLLMRTYNIDKRMVMEVMRVIQWAIEGGLASMWLASKNEGKLQEKRIAFERCAAKIYEKTVARRESTHGDVPITRNKKRRWKVNQPIMAKDSFGIWANGIVKQIHKNRVKVHFSNYTDKWDAWYHKDSQNISTNPAYA